MVQGVSGRAPGRCRRVIEEVLTESEKCVRLASSTKSDWNTCKRWQGPICKGTSIGGPGGVLGASGNVLAAAFGSRDDPEDMGAPSGVSQDASRSVKKLSRAVLGGQVAIF